MFLSIGFCGLLVKKCSFVGILSGVVGVEMGSCFLSANELVNFD